MTSEARSQKASPHPPPSLSDLGVLGTASCRVMRTLERPSEKTADEERRPPAKPCVGAPL